MLHGDNQYNPEYLKEMIKMLIKDNNIAAVSGSRMSKKINALKGKMPIYKFIGNIFLTKLFDISEVIFISTSLDNRSSPSHIL